MINRSLLVVDDDQKVIDSLTRELRNEDYHILGANSGEEGLDLVEKLEIGVVMSDQMMPGMDGTTFLGLLKQKDPDAVRILLTGHGSLETAMEAINNSQIYSYLTKPWSSDALKQTVTKAFEHYNLVIENKRLQKETKKQNHDLKRFNANLEGVVNKRTGQLVEAVREGIFMLAMAAEAKDDDTGEHVHRIRELTLELCIGIGLSPKKSELISFFSMIHDIGKIHIPDRILKKKSHLSTEEWIIMQTHPIAGDKILGNKPFYRTAREIARSHHERWDGIGYPDGLSGESIPFHARIVTIVDIFDALTHARHSKEGWPVKVALGEMENLSGKVFDPDILSVFLKIQIEKKSA